MAWIVPDDLEEAVHGAARAALGDAPLATAPLTRAIVDRSRRYTSERDRAAPDRTADLAARAMFFTVADAMKIAIPLGELARRGAIPAGRPLRVVDVGAGCGAMTLGALVALEDRSAALEVTAIDRDAGALAILRGAVRALAARRGRAVGLAVRDEDVTRCAIPPAELVVMGTVLNELAAPARVALVERALAAIGEDGAVIVIEPALRDTARALHELRDAVVGAGRAHVFAPCTRGRVPCPALADPSDWCHEDRALTLPRRTAELARVTHLRDGGMKFAYLVLRRAPLAQLDGADAWRVVSAGMTAKGKREVIACGDHGRVPVRRLTRHRAAGNRAFDHAERGDVLVIDAGPGTERVEITGETAVVRHALEP